MSTTNTATLEQTPEHQIQNYSLVGEDTQKAIDSGLAEAEWYVSPVTKKQMRELLTRRNFPAMRDCIIYFGIIGISAYATIQLWGSWWAIIPIMIYGLLYASASDSRWHESSHGTAFKTDIYNSILYEISSFMVMRESTPWRWSHTRHHSDTLVVGRDPEIAVPRPPDIVGILLSFINYQSFKRYFKHIILHSTGKLSPEEATFIPEDQRQGVYLRARIYATIFIVIFGLAIYYQTLLPFVFVLGPNLYAAWLMPLYGLTQHTGLAENVLDHRLNCRTIKMNVVNRFLYWNMNYHTEHHMFPLVPYHQLPKLHELVKDDCPAPYTSLWDAYSEIIPTVLRQTKDPGFYVRRKLPDTARPVGTVPTAVAFTAEGRRMVNGWIEVCSCDVLEPNDVVRFDYDHKTYAVYRTDEDTFHATDGICTHGNTHLADGLVKGKIVECPKHNGRFDICDGSPKRAPVCVALKTYEVEIRENKIFINLAKAGGEGLLEKTYRFKVVSNHNVATFIKELVLVPADGCDFEGYRPGEYMQIDIPTYEKIDFSEFDIDARFNEAWKTHNLYNLSSHNELEVRRNYSLATNPETDGKKLRFNVRIATPPKGQDCSAGVGSSYMFNLKPGDEITAVGSFGDFHIKETEKEMVYLGGGAGMAPLRSHLSHLLEVLKTDRKISYWYGARAEQELFYVDYFRDLEKRFPNFSFHIALSDEKDGSFATGFIHQYLNDTYLTDHANVADVEFYLCGPPLMAQASLKMLTDEYGVPLESIAFDEF